MVAHALPLLLVGNGYSLSMISRLIAVMRRLATAGRLAAAGRRVRAGRDIHIGTGTKLWAPVGISIGDHVYIGKNVLIECNAHIGSFVMIANNVGLVGRHDHGGIMYGRWPGLATAKLDQGVDLAVTTDYRTVLAEALANSGLAAKGSFPDWRPDATLGIFGGA